jgi:hypothetical protein
MQQHGRSGQMRKHYKTIKNLFKTASCAACLIGVNGGFTAISSAEPVSSAADWHYADVADLFAGAPITLRAKITAATRLKTPPSPTGAIRFYVEADVIALIRSPQPLPPRLVWLVDLVPDSRGKIPKLKKVDVLVAAQPVAGRPSEIRLAARDAQLFWTAALETRIRNVTSSVAAPDAPPAITGIASAFHTAGTVTGEGETQIFLSTTTKAPISITVLTRPGEPKRWAYALGEIVDEAATPPARDTLAWYRLACFLPRALPAAAVGEISPANAESAQRDYDFVIKALGPCLRSRG